MVALPHSPLSGFSHRHRKGTEDPRSRPARGAAIHAISARSGHAHHRDMHTLTPRTPHGAPGAKKNRGSRVGDAAPAGSRGELVLRGRHVCIEAAALMGEREGERGAPLPSSFLNGERRGQRRPSTLPHHPHTRHTFMLSTQPPIVEGTRSIALTREALQHGGAARPNDLNAMLDCLPSTLQHHIRPRVQRGNGPVERAQEPTRRRGIGRAEPPSLPLAYSTSVGPSVTRMACNPFRRECLVLQQVDNSMLMTR